MPTEANKTLEMMKMLDRMLDEKEAAGETHVLLSIKSVRLMVDILREDIEPYASM